MEKQDLGRLGFRADSGAGSTGGASDAGGGGGNANAGADEGPRGGFVAGLKRVQVLRESKEKR